MGCLARCLKRAQGAALIALLSTALPGCGGWGHHGLAQWGDDIHVTKSATFGQWKIDGVSVAVLNARVNFGMEGYRLDVARSLSTVLKEGERKIKVVPVEQTLSEINRSGLAGQHANMMEEYQRTGILDRRNLQEIGGAVNAQYVILPTLAMFSQGTAGRLSVPFIGMRLFQTRITYLRLSAEMWDTTTGEMVCNAAGEATLAIEDVREKRISFDQIAIELWKRILQKMEV